MSLSAGIDPAILANPFFALSQGIRRPESIAFACAYAVFALLYATRLRRRRKYAFAWRFMLLFSVFRIASFAVRAVVASTAPSAPNFMALLITNGVLTVAAFLFLAEAILALLFQYLCALRGIAGEGHVAVAVARHAAVASISVLGIVGAVLQITSVDTRDMAAFERAKKLRQASGGMFCAVSLYAMVSPVVISYAVTWHPGNPAVHRLVPTLVFSLAGACLLLESIYRVWSASTMGGWIASEAAVDTMLVLPEFVALAMLLIFDLDDFEHVVVCNPFVRIETREAGDTADSNGNGASSAKSVAIVERETKEQV